MKTAVIGIDIGGTKIAAHLSDNTGRTVYDSVVTLPTPHESQPGALNGLQFDTPDYQAALLRGRSALLKAVIDVCRRLQALAEQHHLSVRAVGIGSAGQIDPVHGIVVDANLNLVGWKGTPIAAAVREAVELPVYVDNDVRVMALAEATLGAAKGYRHVLCITVGTGIGGALLLDGSVWHGAHFSAGEIGYLYAEAGDSIEMRFSGTGIANRWNADHPTSPPRTLRDIAAAGDPESIAAIHEAAHGLGVRLAPVLTLIDPEALVIGGGVPEIGALWWTPFVDALRASPLRTPRSVPVLPAALGSQAGMIGAALLALQALE